MAKEEKRIPSQPGARYYIKSTLQPFEKNKLDKDPAKGYVKPKITASTSEGTSMMSSKDVIKAWIVAESPIPPTTPIKDRRN